ncbi:MAG: diguanylate cyclase [Spirochaetales bacterium]|nr:diguanylate cyclase [Spirochaetales bacterium]
MKRRYRHTESLLRSMMESPDQLLIWAVDKDYRYLFFNNSHKREMEHFWHADIELGEDIFSYITDPRYRKAVEAKYQTVFKQGKSGVSVDELVDSSGNKRYFENYGSPVFDDDNTILGLVLYTIEITDRVRAERELERVSVTDKLTGLYNRNKLDGVLEQELQRARRYGRSFSLLMADIDHFKKVNDTLGHVAGDQVLKELGVLLRENTREVDTSGRWSGEEFITLCPETNLQQAVKIAEKMRTLVEEHPFSTGCPITWSIGVAEFQDEASVTELIEKVDAAMYKAKNEGRNRVCVEENG